VKWGHPCYRHAGRNIALIGALRDDFRISFFDAALLQDQNEVLEKAGPNTQHADMIRFRTNEEPALREGTIAAYLREAMRLAESGARYIKAAQDLVLPPELVDSLDRDPDLADAFAALTRGRQRSYVIALQSAKTAATRAARIARFRDRIIAGKGATER
jgi:uncharacterized protein YdeI (YjbR/CyaY-like superfamily)